MRRDDDVADIDVSSGAKGKKGGRARAGSNAGSKEFVKEFARAIKSVNDKNDRDNPGKKQGISLSGLLNAIDGVASHEGRVLIMTTNFPEKLDEALIRPGRVDMKIEFSLATREQIRELFIRMYSSDSAKRAKIMANGFIAAEDDITREESSGHGHEKVQSNGALLNGLALEKPAKPISPPMTPTTSSFPQKPNPNTSPVKPPSSILSGINVSHTEILHLASEFATKLPESTFSPAEIQGFLLTRKKDPKKAVEEVNDWRDRTLQAKEAKKNILSNGTGRSEGEESGVEVEAPEAEEKEGGEGDE